jgi:hypothetical protein
MAERNFIERISKSRPDRAPKLRSSHGKCPSVCHPTRAAARLSSGDLMPATRRNSQAESSWNGRSGRSLTANTHALVTQHESSGSTNAMRDVPSILSISRSPR